MELVTLYVHKESNKVVSRLCTGCQAVKLLEEFSSDPTKKQKYQIHWTIKCNQCVEDEKGDVQV
ncbi:hypothetical protein [Exiguobacterium sp. s131]|uniref:hypothetical protein n=1 Tax=Exiguobacterium sp. s131 TaxID=2751278 RepID=UPI001BE547CE|nr:hypothetical protein [Exiguobacterium sp. s131]